MKKIILTISIIIMILFANTSLATNIEKALLYNDHYTKEYLYFNNGNKVKTAVIMYNNNGVKYPAYCVERLKDGVGELPSYEVQFKNKISDNGLWRIITNGYPYKTPSQMGLENADEAYFATKQAIYRYLENESVDYYAGGIGDEGKRVYNAIANLLNIGYNEENEYGEVNIFVEKIGKPQTQDEYFVQECQIKCDIDYKNIKITSDYKISDLNGNKFNIYIPIQVENPKVKLNIELDVNTKPLLYGEAYNPDYQDYIITGNSYENINNQLEIEIQTPKLYDIQIVKYDNNGELLEGAKFEILDKDNNVIDTVVTNDKGIGIIRNLEIGTYIIKEIEAPQYYLIDNTIRTVNLNKDEVIIFTNEKVEVLVDIEKTGTSETEPGLEVEYIFPKIENKSNTKLDNLIWVEELPKEVNIKEMHTGTYNQDINYSVFYEINGEWKLYGDDFSSRVNNKLEFNEKIDKIKVEFGKVDINFSVFDKPTITAIVNKELSQGDYFINSTSLTGYYKEKWNKDTSEHITIVYEKEEPPIILPKTGK